MDCVKYNKTTVLVLFSLYFMRQEFDFIQSSHLSELAWIIPSQNTSVGSGVTQSFCDQNSRYDMIVLSVEDFVCGSFVMVVRPCEVY